MAVIVKTGNPRALLSSIIQEIENNEIDTWEYYMEHFSHTPDQWKRRAYFAPIVRNGELYFKLVAPQDRQVDIVVSSIYHGRFIEMIIGHYSNQIYSTIAEPPFTAS